LSGTINVLLDVKNREGFNLISLSKGALSISINFGKQKFAVRDHALMIQMLSELIILGKEFL
jgi:hypothetical protein